MVQMQTLPKLMTFAEFLEWKPENGRYELYEGVIIPMQPTGKHEEIVEFLNTQFTLEAARLNLPYRFLKTALVKLESRESGYLPDVLVVNKNNLKNEPLWEKKSTLTQGKSIPLVVEVVSRNWRDDYLTKLRDYEEMGITEYWIVDYLGLGGSRYIGHPKQPTVLIYQLIDGEYQVKFFRNNDPIQSMIFSELNLTANQIFQGEI